MVNKGNIKPLYYILKILFDEKRRTKQWQH